jgi:DNA ligase 1
MNDLDREVSYKLLHTNFMAVRAKNIPKLLLAKSWWDTEGLDPRGWWQSEKKDGVRAFWDGHKLWSRLGNAFPAPSWFTAGLPRVPLDGELWQGRGRFQETIGIVKTRDGSKDNDWRTVKYVVFDMPKHGGTFEERMAALKKLHARSPSPYWKVLKQTRVKSRAAMLAALKKIGKAGGEGLMLRKPGSLYEGRRSNTLLKVKTFKDGEAIVVGHTKGKGKHADKCGALMVKLPNGKRFKVGTGMSDKCRARPPKIGDRITYRYTELSNDGIPRFASFVAVRDYE